MISMIFFFILVTHGLIHLLGFVKAFNLADVSQLTQSISRSAGALWLISALLFIAAAAAFLFNRQWWWMIAALALILSQTLILLSWKDAKYGTIFNVIILAATVVAYGAWSFRVMARSELKRFQPPAASEKRILTREMLGSLPPAVRQWLIRSGVINKEIIRTAQLKQRGEMRTTPGGRWMSFTAQQWIRTDDPGFIWLADVAAAPGMHLAGRDKYEDGKGHMLIKLFSIFPFANASGSEIDQGAMVRYLAETVWSPSAILSGHVRWEQIGPATAKATMTYGGISATGIFTFDAQGDVESFEAKRYYDRKGGATLENWFINVDPNSYVEFEGVRIAARCTVTWKLKDGDFTWLRLEIEDLSYNKAMN